MLRILFEWFEFGFKCFECLSSGLNLDSNALNPFQVVRICIRMLRIPFEWFKFAFNCFEFAFECFESLAFMTSRFVQMSVWCLGGVMCFMNIGTV